MQNGTLKNYLCKGDELFGKVDVVLLSKLVECRCQLFAVSTPVSTVTLTVVSVRKKVSK